MPSLPAYNIVILPSGRTCSKQYADACFNNLQRTTKASCKIIHFQSFLEVQCLTRMKISLSTRYLDSSTMHRKFVLCVARKDIGLIYKL